MATGLTLKLRAIGGHTVTPYLLPGQLFTPTQRQAKTERTAAKRAKWHARMLERKATFKPFLSTARLALHAKLSAA